MAACSVVIFIKMSRMVAVTSWRAIRVQLALMCSGMSLYASYFLDLAATAEEG